MTDKDDWLGIGDPLGMNIRRDRLQPGPALGYPGLDSPGISEYARLRDAALRSLGINSRMGAQAAQDPELAKYQRAMPNKPLTKPPGHYLTGYEGSPCEPIEDYDLAPFKWKQQGIDTDEFKKQCEEVEKGDD